MRKSWHALINSPWFAAQHLQVYRSLSSSTLILFKRCVRIRALANKEEIVFSFLHLSNVDSDDYESNNLDCVVEDLVLPPSLGLQTRGQYIKLPDPGGDTYTVNIIGHCDGIICLNLYTGDIILYNPTVKELNIVPNPCLPVEDKHTFATVLGFGYDSRSNDYILVRIVVYGEELGNHENLILCISRAEMYTLGTNSWKEIPNDYRGIFWPADLEMYFQGKLYWLGVEEMNKGVGSQTLGHYEKFSSVIILFDMNAESFRTMFLPGGFYEAEYSMSYGFHLAMWEDSIAVSGFHFCRETFHVWVMDGGEGSWSNQFTFECVGIIDYHALAAWGTQEVLSSDDKNGQICLIIQPLDQKGCISWHLRLGVSKKSSSSCLCE